MPPLKPGKVADLDAFNTQADGLRAVAARVLAPGHVRLAVGGEGGEAAC